MSIRLIRQDSQMPNVTNHDDARMVRYAYGGFDGFVKDRGSEIDYAIDGTSFVVQSGVLVLQGWEVEIDANGAAISVPPNVSTTQYFSVYLEVNCGTDTAAIKSTYRSGTYPDIPASDDLTANTVGTARLLLYQFTVTNGVISNVKKAVQGIEYSLYNISELRDGLQDGTIIPANAKSVNSLEIKRDENGVLKIGDTIIPQKKLLWSGEKSSEEYFEGDFGLVIGDLIEVNFSEPYNMKIKCNIGSNPILGTLTDQFSNVIVHHGQTNIPARTGQYAAVALLEFYQNIYRLKVFPVMYAVNEFSTEKDDWESTTGTITSIYKIIE